MAPWDSHGFAGVRAPAERRVRGTRMSVRGFATVTGLPDAVITRGAVMTDPQAWTAPGSRPPEGPPAPLGEASGQPSGRPGGEPARRPAIDRSALLGGDIPLRPLGISEILDGAITNIR